MDQVLDIPGVGTVACAQYGDLDGSPTIYLHGTGSCRLEGAAWGAGAAEHGVRLLAVDRPGRTSRLPPTPSPVQYAAEVAAVADHLGIGRFVLAGHSNGGMYAVAAANVLGDRVSTVVPINPTVPVADPGVRKILRLQGRLTYGLVRPLHRLVARSMAGPGLKESSGLLAKLDADLELWKDPAVGPILRDIAAQQTTVEYLTAELSQGVVNPWGFDHLALAQRVEFVMGHRDVGLPYVRVWSDQLHDSAVHGVPGGHLAHLTPQGARVLIRCLAAAAVD